MAQFNYLTVLILFAFIISSGVYIFSRGFLLTRVARTEKRFCEKSYINLNGKYCLKDDKASVMWFIYIIIQYLTHFISSFTEDLFRRNTN